MPGRIRITSGDDAGRVIEVSDELVLGRRQEGPGKVPDIEISRTHARLYVEPDGGLAIEDLGSTNGTFVKGMRITGPHPLSPGDELRMGTTTFEVEAKP
ncbi:MAG: FHA domain-containing protein, partial [Actinomycetota bacterium]|nr:FHA domain-containing protein [Actinomycetota bacterium]